MPTNYRYRLLQGASWGIAIDVRAEALALPADPSPPGTEKVAEGLWLQAEVGWPLSEEEMSYLKVGLRLVAGEIARRRKSVPVLVRVTTLDFKPSDYQPEGLAAAIAEWAAAEFGFPKPQVSVAFDRMHNRYSFSFGRVEGRPGRSAAAGS